MTEGQRTRAAVVGIHGDALSVGIAAPPVDGAANDEVVGVLAELFGVARAHVTLIRGATARMKLFDVAGTNVDAMRRALDRRL